MYIIKRTYKNNDLNPFSFRQSQTVKYNETPPTRNSVFLVGRKGFFTVYANTILSSDPFVKAVHLELLPAYMFDRLLTDMLMAFPKGRSQNRHCSLPFRQPRTATQKILRLTSFSLQICTRCRK